MPPKVKITKERIIDAALELVRRDGADALNARGIAHELGCSTQPIFSNFSGMGELRLATVARAEELLAWYIEREIASGEFPPYKASGMAYVRFAKEECELFALLYMRDRSGEGEGDSPLFDRMTGVVQTNTGLGEDDARLFHLEMWAYVHGIATMLATGFLELDRELISRMLTDSYLGLRLQYGME